MLLGGAVPIMNLYRNELVTVHHLWYCRLEEAEGLEGLACLDRWDPRLTKASKTLDTRAAWEKLVNAGGSHPRTLALPSSRGSDGVRPGLLMPFRAM
jgi:hypothetical protein